MKRPRKRLCTEPEGKPYPFVEKRLASLQAADRFRFLRTVETEQDSRIVLDGHAVVLFCSNNYLGLANHPDIKEAAREAATRYGCGSGSSRLISGNMHLHEELEARIAAFKRSPECILFNNGYSANVGILSSLMERGDFVFSDSLNHASIIDGCRLSRAEIRIFRHRDPDHLESLVKSSPGTGKRLIVSDSLFSMDGDLAPLPDLVFLANRYDCMLMLDEAHAVGVMGPNGRGVAEHFGMEEAVDISVGTLGKALGSFGAFAACSPALKEYLINHARSFIYSTSLPPPVLAASLKALEILQAEPGRRQRLQQNAEDLGKGLHKLGFSLPEPVTPIQSLVFGEESLAMAMCEHLLQQGVYAQGIRPPTVPPGTARIRFSLMATHTREDVHKALCAIASAPCLDPAEEAAGVKTSMG